MHQSRIEAPEAAEILLRQLRRQGIDFLFANGGTDFPPVVEAYSRAEKDGTDLPRPLVVPHENAAVAMAHGVWLATGRMQAVMVHVNVGTANTINAVMDASREQVPVLVLAGRSPFSEKGRHGTRTRYIHWAQEMFDQAGMIREAVKWDYELHLPEQTADVIARACEVAESSPKGPVYLTLPRDVLAAPAFGTDTVAPRPPVQPGAPHDDHVKTVAAALSAAERPVVVTANAGRSALAFELLSTLAERHAIPVANLHQRFVSIASDHPMNAGHDPAPYVREADVVLVLDCDVPWIPNFASPPEGCKVFHVGEDPVFARYPMRSFPSDLSIAAEPARFLSALLQEMKPDDALAARRRERLVPKIAAGREAQAAKAEPGDALTPEYVSRVIGEVAGPEAVIVNEYPLRVEHCERTRPGTYYGLSPAGGLGWGLGAALGIKLATPEKTVVATLGDGAYIFANPTACHWVAEAHGLPILTVVFNNALHGAVRNATMAMYPKGAAAKGAGRMLADLAPSPAFECLAGAKGHGERVDTVEGLKPALERALAAVAEGRQALLNVVVDY
ncbi:thiamine pyrophosphate-requiring protein [Jiella sonneratiae]|uniref:Thiamine pyrophosphate-requiring protein n=1 Tax=Jiella sonneratiae TaxID=2816856 RepID=A0ABS3J257_9HYPH|nr:thiamine pyrophosphate-requiring protein [Jiella sonneratiae]MBO0903756.1 thiamine pyrophosphate-requiring protein [Jiella sonneratiae]